jgi:hypothetical protein
MSMTDTHEDSEIQAVAQRGDGIYLLRLAYDVDGNEGDVGDVFEAALPHKDGERPKKILSTNDSLRCLWASPQGSLWVASALGVVASTAALNWPAPARGARYTAPAPFPAWTATDLPPLRRHKRPPDLSALWGTADDDMYAGAYGGHVYHWDGRAWTQVVDGPDSGASSIRAFGGRPGDVYAVGESQTLLHFDGAAWQPLRIPGVPDASENFTGICETDGGDMLVSAAGGGGRLLQGSAAGGFIELGKVEMALLAMIRLHDRILFATGDAAAELIGRDVRVIKDVPVIAAFAGEDRAFFLQAEQPEPEYIEYYPPDEDSPWMIYGY